MDENIESMGTDVTLDERDCDPNDEISVPSPTATREEPPVNFCLVITRAGRRRVEVSAPVHFYLCRRRRV